MTGHQKHELLHRSPPIAGTGVTRFALVRGRRQHA